MLGAADGSIQDTVLSMNRHTNEKMERQLLEAEDALRERLLSALPAAALSGHDLFTNSRFNRFQLNHLSPLSNEFLAAAEQCIAWRQSLDLPVEQSVGQLFVAACDERNGVDEHRRGPRKLAAWLVSQLAPVE